MESEDEATHIIYSIPDSAKDDESSESTYTVSLELIKSFGWIFFVKA